MYLSQVKRWDTFRHEQQEVLEKLFACYPQGDHL